MLNLSEAIFASVPSNMSEITISPRASINATIIGYPLNDTRFHWKIPVIQFDKDQITAGLSNKKNPVTLQELCSFEDGHDLCDANFLI